MNYPYEIIRVAVTSCVSPKTKKSVDNANLQINNYDVVIKK